MKKIKQSILLMAVAAGAILASASSVQAQNTLHGPADLVLTLQNPGGTNPTNTMVIALGSVQTIFRNAAPGSFTNLINIGSQLGTTFGATWADENTLFAGAVGFLGTSDVSNALIGLGDPHRTLYMTKIRTAVGTPGLQNSPGINLPNLATMTSATSNIGVVKNNLETIASNTAVGVFTTLASSVVDDQNPFTAPLIQSTGYGTVAGGVQANFGAGIFGSFGQAGNVEVALDLFRIQARNDIVSQFGFSQPVRQGQFLGTLTIGSGGQVGFTAVPEPSTYALLALAGLALAVAARRRKSVQS